ncbi:MAG: tripartite tricarboxylate transporter substrate binding protein [Burkholderiaceae bacterium]
MKLGLISKLVALAAALVLQPAVGQSYPTRAIKIIVPATPGGAIDQIARSLADKMTTSMGQPVLVENKPGASNNVGTDFVAKSAPDGYTLVIVASSHATNKFLYKNMPFDPVKDFAPVAYTHVVPLLVAIHPSIPAKTPQELVAWIKANPNKANYATSGPGSSQHMATELFMSMSQTKMQHVPYKGSSAAHPDLLAGRTAMFFDPMPAIRAHVKSGALRGLAVTTLNRSGAFPELPTMAESGFPGYEATTWGGILAPAGTPKEIVNKLNAAINEALKLDDVRTRLTGAGIEIQSGTPEHFAKVIQSEVDKWGRITKEAGILPE